MNSLLSSGRSENGKTAWRIGTCNARYSSWLSEKKASEGMQTPVSSQVPEGINPTSNTATGVQFKTIVWNSCDD